MPRPSKQATTNPTPRKGELDSLVYAADAEAAKWVDPKRATRLTYEAKAKQLADGWDMGTACKKSRYSMRAAGLWVMRKQLKALLKEARRVRKNGLTGAELFVLREAQFAQKMEEVKAKLLAIREFEELPWSVIADPARRLQKSHKQGPATDAELVAFYEGAAKSSYRKAFLVAEFSGCRGEEFGEGIRVEVGKKGGASTITFFIQSAKADGEKKGVEFRAIEVPFPAEAAEPVQRRWLELAKSVAQGGKSHVVRIDATAKSTAGQLFTNACKTVSKKAAVSVAAYSFRNRFAAQTKQANKGDPVAVALALGHQTTETQRHYARASRGGGNVSPVQSKGINVAGVVIRGAPNRAGPPLHKKEKLILAALTAKATAAAPPPRRMRL